MKIRLAETAFSEILEDEAEAVALITVGWCCLGEVGRDPNVIASVLVDFWFFMGGEEVHFVFVLCFREGAIF